MQPAELRQTERQVAIGTEPALVDEGALWAVHRLEAEGLAFGLQDEHAVLVVGPVARLLPQLLVDQHRRADLLVAAPVLDLADRRFQRSPQALALGVPEGRAGADVVEAEEIELHAEAAMIAAFGFFAPAQVRVELFLGRPDSAVDALQHRPLLGAAPVGAGHGHELERPDLARAGNVRALAQVYERAVLVGGRGRQRRAGFFRARGQVVEDLDLEGLAAGVEEGTALAERDFLADEGVVRGDGRAHSRLYRREIVGRERARQQEVVVEAVLDRRPDAELRVREESHDGFRHDMRGGVAHRVEIRVRTGVEQLLYGSPNDGLEVLLAVRGFGAGRRNCRDLPRCVLAHVLLP